ncbi:unnamed protein product [Paramecium sonneborni]|uniref:Transmembrane protein n=1 Tax=Paramecium sonneborni TaxID=65129 RepID=A0A8S1QYX1_9CILI|nr:unnamed protein product [Paramecium sonneborni]
MIMIIFVSLIGNIYCQAIGTISCFTLDQITCENSGYCYWKNSQCLSLQCHLVNNLAACRSGGALENLCKQVSYTPPQFIASCCNIAYTAQKIYLYRFLSDLSEEDKAQTQASIIQLSSEQPSVQAMDKLFQLDFLSSSQAQLCAILDLYIKQAAILIGKYSHPYYLERAIYESLQNVRDDLYSDSLQRSSTICKILELIDIYYQRLNTYSEKYYTVYNFVNFNHIHLKYLGFQFQQQIFLSWETYPENGFFELTVIYPQIFGIQNAVSPIFMIQITNEINLKYKIKWAKTTLNTVQLMKIDLVKMIFYEVEFQQACSNGYCNVIVSGSGNFLFVDPTISNNCPDILDLTLCILAKCTISGVSCI